jgi:hypothetical protein
MRKDTLEILDLALWLHNYTCSCNMWKPCEWKKELNNSNNKNFVDIWRRSMHTEYLKYAKILFTLIEVKNINIFEMKGYIIKLKHIDKNFSIKDYIEKLLKEQKV